MALHTYARVARTVIKDGAELETGEVVDYSEFKWGEQLVDQGRLDREIDPDLFRTCVCGTVLANDQWYEYHQERHCEFDLDTMKRDDLLDILEDEFGVVEEDIDGTGSDGYVKVSDIRDRLQEELES